MTRVTLARLLNNDNLGLEGPAIQQKPFIGDMLALLTPVIDRGEVFKERIQFTAIKTIAGAPEGAVFTLPLVEAQTVEIWEHLWISHNEAALGRNFFLDLIIRAGAGQVISKIQAFGGASPRPLLGVAYDEGIDDFNNINPLVVTSGQQISINTATLMAIGTVITASGVGYRIQGAADPAQEIGSLVAIL